MLSRYVADWHRGEARTGPRRLKRVGVQRHAPAASLPEKEIRYPYLLHMRNYTIYKAHNRAW